MPDQEQYHWDLRRELTRFLTEQGKVFMLLTNLSQMQQQVRHNCALSENLGEF